MPKQSNKRKRVRKTAPGSVNSNPVPAPAEEPPVSRLRPSRDSQQEQIEAAAGIQVLRTNGILGW